MLLIVGCCLINLYCIFGRAFIVRQKVSSTHNCTRGRGTGRHALHPKRTRALRPRFCDPVRSKAHLEASWWHLCLSSSAWPDVCIMCGLSVGWLSSQLELNTRALAYALIQVYVYMYISYISMYDLLCACILIASRFLVRFQKVVDVHVFIVFGLYWSIWTGLNMLLH